MLTVAFRIKIFNSQNANTFFLGAGDLSKVPIVVTLHLEVEHFAFGIASIWNEMLVEEFLKHEAWFRLIGQKNRAFWQVNIN